MNKKTILSIFTIIILAWLVSAAIGDGLKIITPTSGTNFTSITGIIFNVTYGNATDIIDPSNATFYLNISGTWQPIGNTSISGGCARGATIGSCSANLTNTTIPDGIYSLNATIYNGSSSVSIIQTENLSTNIIIDSSPPQVYEANFTKPLSGTNHSAVNGNLVINVSIVDPGVGIQAVFFNITNTSSQNASYTASREGTSDNFVYSLNTTFFFDGTYNITVYANDTFGQLNDTGSVLNINFDNTNPSASASCSSTDIDVGDAFPCTCSGTDTLSYVNSSVGSSSSPDGVGTPGNSGSFTFTCVSYDSAGNSATATKSYIVSESSFAGSSGSSSSSGSSKSPSNSNNNQDTTTNSSTTGNSQDSASGQANSKSSSNSNSSSNTIWFVLIALIIIAGIAYYFMRKK